ncbi:hypothetical protein L21SP2_1347 [Salinispira pacifica]|uniref:Uncharacterized protein n=2 Tax=Salinispira pacifica TaxID=1307761 RepID=V5WHU8_9SPIO|nr:hypothetical protein L21SP2_1347 [Salinispira pacifica]
MLVAGFSAVLPLSLSRSFGLSAQVIADSDRVGWPPASDQLDIHSMADAAFEAGDYPRAVRLYRRLLQSAKAEIYVRLAESHLLASQPLAALGVLNQARRQPGVSEPELLFLRARAHVLLEQPERAVEYVDMLLADSPQLYAEYPEIWRGSHKLRLAAVDNTRAREQLFTDLSAPWYTRAATELERTAARALYGEQRYEELASWLDARFSRFPGLTEERELQLLRAEALYFLSSAGAGSGEPDPGSTDPVSPDSVSQDREDVIAAYENLRSRVDEFTPQVYVRLFDLYRNRAAGGAPQVSELLEAAQRDLEAHPDILGAFYERMLSERFPSGDEEAVGRAITRLDRLGTEFQSYITPYYKALRLLRDEDPGSVDAARQAIRSYLRAGGENDPWLDLLLSELDYRQGNYSAAWQRIENPLPQESDASATVYGEDFRRQRLEIMLYSLYAAGEYQRSARLGAEHVDEYPRIRPVTARSYGGMGNFARAVQVLEPLFSPGSGVSPEDGLRSEYYQYLVKLGRWPDIISAQQGFSPDQPRDYPASRYLYGLALIQTGNFPEAVKLFGTLIQEEPGAELEIYADYYLGWASFRSSRDETALEAYERLVNRLKDDVQQGEDPAIPSAAPGALELFVRGAYEGAWAALRMEDYERGLDLLNTLLDSSTSPSLQETPEGGEAADIFARAVYLRAKLLMLDQRAEDAAAALIDFRDRYPRHELADEALLDYARVRASQGQVNRAVRSLYELISAYPDNSNAALAAYRIGELYYQNDRFQEAREAFNSYRDEYPRDGNIDAALYFSGRASWQSGETAAARLYWNNLVENFPDSYFRLNTMLLLAELYAEQGRESAAAGLYDMITSEYPGQAENLGIEERKSALSRSAPADDSWSVLESDPRLTEQAARDRVLELGKTLIIDQAGIRQRSQDLGPYLETLSSSGDASPRERSRALYLLGRGALQRAEYSRAAEYFIDAALSNSSDWQRAPEYLYFALESYSRQGADQEALAIYQQMKEIYPDSSWTLDGRRAIRRYIPGALPSGDDL